MICLKNVFRAISFEIIDVLDSYFIHRYIIIKYRSSSIKNLLFFVRVMALDLCKKNGFQVISFEYIALLDLCSNNQYIIIKHRSSLIKDQIHRFLSE